MSQPHFADRLIGEIERKGSCLVVGIDPRMDLIPDSVKAKAGGDAIESCATAIERFGKGLIDAVADLVPAVKPQVAFYERFGWPGYRAFCETARYARAAGLIVIGDVKRSDIGSTVHAYADGLLGAVVCDGKEIEPVGLDAVTVNAYLGTDGIKPFLGVAAEKGKGVFVLVRTSNPSASELQDRECAGEKVYEIMADLVAGWGAPLMGAKGYSAVGAVVGATYPEEARQLRRRLPSTLFLMPGVGAQEGDVGSLGDCFDAKGHGALIAASRSVDYAFRSEAYRGRFGEARWQGAAAEAVKDLSEAINAVRLKGCKR